MNFTLRSSAAIFAALVLPATAFAQVVTPTAAPAPIQPAGAMVIARPTTQNILPQGTSIRFRTLTELSSQASKVGQRFDLEVAEDVMLNGRVVIPRGSPGIGDITLIKKKGMWGKSGKLEARVLSVRANGIDVPVRGTVGDKGETGTAGVVGAIVVLPIAGFFVTGTSAVLPAGTGANAILESDLPIVFESSAPAPTPSAVK